jgi:ferric-dicitrate binding protein FerR (iron transport regulator)
MASERRDEPFNEDFCAAWRLFMALHDAPTTHAAEELIGWLRLSPRNVLALDEALTVWAMASVALMKGRDDPDAPEPRSPSRR